VNTPKGKLPVNSVYVITWKIMKQQENTDNIGIIKVIKRPELSSSLIDDK
ncbi:21710_t:CDS:1, partial [Entrophospora sp. SA101]